MKKVFSIGGICMGILIMIIGICLAFGAADAHVGSSVDSSASFGADFYTYEYKATASAANSVKNMARSMESFFRLSGFICLGFGGSIACYFGCVFADTKKNIPAVAQVVNRTANVTKEDELPDL